MKKHIFITLLLLTTSTVFAQGPRKRFKKIKAHKTAYITNQVELTASEAEVFWPVYNTYAEKLHQLQVVERRKLHKNIKEKGGIDQLTESEAKKDLKTIRDLKEQIFDLEQKKYRELRKVLSAKKMLKLHRAERSFKRELLKKLKKQRERRR